MNTVASFESQAFNTTEVREDFINPCCFGDDLARWLMEGLRAAGASVEGEPGQEDFGWYFEFAMQSQRYCLVVSGDGEGGWCTVLERSCGLFASLLGGRHRSVGQAGRDALEALLAGSERVRNLRWSSWAEFRRGQAA